MTVPTILRREGSCYLLGDGAERRLALPLLTEVPDLIHGFTTRGADPSKALAAAAGRPLPLYALHQVHGRQVHVLEESNALSGPILRGDALITRRRDVGLQVRVADCVPVLVCDPVSGWLGAVHAGWRGTVAGVLTAAIRSLVGRGCRAADLLVALGPSIGPCCYEVGWEVVSAFRESGPAGRVAVAAGSRPRVDLIEANRQLALEEGVPEERIASARLCTACRTDLLESYRRSGGAPSRTAGVIAWRR